MKKTEEKVTEPNILIAGAGSGIGLATAKRLSEIVGAGEIFSSNVTDDYPARRFINHHLKSPDFYFAKEATQASFVEFIKLVVERHNLHFIVPAGIFELPALSEISSELSDVGCRVIVESMETIDTYSDKLRTTETLNMLGVLAPKSLPVGRSNYEELEVFLGTTFFVKPRNGYGSNGTSIVSSQADLEAANDTVRMSWGELIAQTYLPNSDAEYSGSIVYGADGRFKDGMVVRRLKLDGVTRVAVRDEECECIERALPGIAAAVAGRYCINIQFRIHDNEICVFEVNPRFGASEPIRRQLGLNTVHSVLSEYAALSDPAQIKRRFGRVYRELDEIYVDR